MLPIRLTQFSHGGGCGCKIAPALLHDMLKDLPSGILPPALLVGTETSDDAAVYQLNAEQAIIATTDFFMPIVDDPHSFGEIAATNAISDIYAMGGKPLFALAIVGMPIDKLPLDVMQAILAGGESACRRAGIPVAGGHSIDTVEPIYGLAVIGLAHPDHIKRNNAAQTGDVLILGKALGVGILSSALKKGELPDEGYAEMLATTTQLNTPGTSLANLPGVHAMTDVTGFGLLGHLLEICRGSQLDAHIDFNRLPLLPAAVTLAKSGHAPGAAARNWSSYGADVSLPENTPLWQKNLLCDPQTSGGLLIACAPDTVEEVLTCFANDGFMRSTTIGTLQHGIPHVHVHTQS